MHEYPITEQIVKIAEKHAAIVGAFRVNNVNLVVGDYSGFVGESIQMYFDLIAEGTVCQGAKVNFVRVTPKVKCNICGELFERKPLSFDCPKEDCVGIGEPTKIGKEFYIESIEVE